MWTSSFESIVLSPFFFCLCLYYKVHHSTFFLIFHPKHGSSFLFCSSSINKLRCFLILVNSPSYSSSFILLSMPFSLASSPHFSCLSFESTLWLLVVVFFSSSMSFSMLIVNYNLSPAVASLFHLATNTSPNLSLSLVFWYYTGSPSLRTLLRFFFSF